MKLYYYIHTGHRFGLDRLRRGAAFYKQLQKHGFEPEVLLNDYRATMVAKELGIEASTAIDSMYNIATMAEAGDGLIIDTPELTEALLQQMCAYFRVVVNFSNEKRRFSEKIVSQIREDSDTVRLLPVDASYFESGEKSPKSLLFYGDEDYEKNLLQHLDRFKGVDDLLLGHYFFLQYERQLEPHFKHIREDYDYIKDYEIVYSKSFQSALEAGASGAQVLCFDCEMLSLVTVCKELGLPVEKMSEMGNEGVLPGFINRERLRELSVDIDYEQVFNKLDLGQFRFN